MGKETGFLELRGGRYDGYCRPLPYVPLWHRLELRVPSPCPSAQASPPYVAVYIRAKSRIVLEDSIPTLAYRFEFACIQPRAYRRPTKGFRGWMGRFRRKLHGCCRTVSCW
jgi:hypothetical protein